MSFSSLSSSNVVITQPVDETLALYGSINLTINWYVYHDFEVASSSPIDPGEYLNLSKIGPR